MVGYEEATLPTFCANNAACTLAEFSSLKNGLQNHVTWRAGFSWDCAQFVGSARLGTNEVLPAGRVKPE